MGLEDILLKIRHYNASMNASNASLSDSPDSGTEPSRSQFDLAIIASVLFLVGVSGNLGAIVTYCVSRRLRCPQNLFVINLALADCLTLACVPVVVVNVFTDRLQRMPVACLSVVIFLRLSTILGMVSISAIGVVRYLSIVHPQSKAAIFTWPRCATGLAATWVYAAFWTSLPFALGLGHVEYNPRMYICLIAHNDVVLTTSLFVSTYVLSVLLIGYSYARIYVTVRRSSRRVQAAAVTPPTSRVFSVADHQRGSTKAVQPNRMSNETKLATQLLIIFFVFVLCWAPYISYTMFDTSTTLSMPQAVYDLFIIGVEFNAAVNPLIYFCYNHLYRQAFRALFCRCFKPTKLVGSILED